MKTRRYFAAAAVVFTACLLATPEAEARRGWRRARTSTFSSARSSATRRYDYGRIAYSGVSRAEHDLQRRRDAWFEDAYNGWRPADFN